MIEFDFSEARVVVTGAGFGIGLAIAQAFHSAGARVALGDLQGETVERAAIGLGDGRVAAHQVLDLGAVPNRQLPRVLREATVGMFPSRAEGGTNLGAMECLACGVPALLSDNTGHRDLLALGAGLLLTRQDPVPGAGHADWGESSVEEIVAALQRAYDDPDGMRAHGARAAAIMAELSWRTQMDQLAAPLTPLQT